MRPSSNSKLFITRLQIFLTRPINRQHFFPADEQPYQTETQEMSKSQVMHYPSIFKLRRPKIEKLDLMESSSGFPSLQRVSVSVNIKLAMYVSPDRWMIPSRKYYDRQKKNIQMQGMDLNLSQSGLSPDALMQSRVF